LTDSGCGPKIRPNAAFARPFAFLECDLPLPEHLSLVSRQQKRARQVVFVFIAATVFLIACWLLI